MPRSSSLGSALRRNRADGVRLELCLVRLGRVELDPGVREHCVQLGELADQITARVTVTQEREDVVVVAPQQRRGKPERRIVLGLQPELEHESVSGPLVQVQAELPAGRRALAEAGADPARQPPLERRVAGVAWEHRVGGGQPFEEQVERRRTSRPHAHSRGGRRPRAGDRARSGRRARGTGRAPWRPGRRRTRRRRQRVAPQRSRSESPGRSGRASLPRTRATSRRRGRGQGGRGLRRRSDAPVRRGRRSPARSRRGPASAGGASATRISSWTSSRRARKPPPASARFATAGFPSSRSPADSAPSASRTKRIAVASCCQTSSSVVFTVVPSSNINLSR